MVDKLIIDYVREEAERCAQLCEAIPNDPEFLKHCILYAVQPSEIEERRKRFDEFPKPDNFEDLM
jgi:hypothetical protein